MSGTEIPGVGPQLRQGPSNGRRRRKRPGRRAVSIVCLVLVAAGISLAVDLSHSSGSGFNGPRGSNPNGPGFTSGTGNTGTGNTGTGNTGTGNTGTGNTGTGNTGTGSPDTGNTGTGSPDTGNTGAGTPDTGNTGNQFGKRWSRWWCEFHDPRGLTLRPLQRCAAGPGTDTF